MGVRVAPHLNSAHWQIQHPHPAHPAIPLNPPILGLCHHGLREPVCGPTIDGRDSSLRGAGEVIGLTGSLSFDESAVATPQGWASNGPSSMVLTDFICLTGLAMPTEALLCM